MQYFYITHRDHLSTITEEGINNKTENGLVSMPNISSQKAWLTNNVDRMIYNHLDEKSLRADFVVLFIDTKGLKVVPHEITQSGKVYDSEYLFTVTKVSPLRIDDVKELTEIASEETVIDSYGNVYPVKFKATCINSNNVGWMLTKGTDYCVIENTKGHYEVVADTGLVERFNHARFKRIGWVRNRNK